MTRSSQPLSGRYSTSPVLHLRIGESKILKCLHLALLLAVLCSLFLVYLDGYALLALGLLPMAVLLGWQTRTQPFSGALLCWREGHWSLDCGGGAQPLKVGQRSVCLPWVIYVSLRRIDQSRQNLWLFADSAAQPDLRYLRVRLALER